MFAKTSFFYLICGLALQDFREAVAVMLFYQVDELLQDLAVDKSTKSISKLLDLRPDYCNARKTGKLFKLTQRLWLLAMSLLFLQLKELRLMVVAELLECGVRFLLMLVLLLLQFAMHFALSLSKRIKKINNLNNLLKNIYMPYNQRSADIFYLSKN